MYVVDIIHTRTHQKAKDNITQGTVDDRLYCGMLSEAASEIFNGVMPPRTPKGQ